MQRAPCIVDTNVPLVANGQNTAAGAACRLASVEALQEVMRCRSVVVDDAWEILGEYDHKLNSHDRQLVGNEFYHWVLGNLFRIELVQQVKITKRSKAVGDYAEFPDTPDLASFDKSDRKFVAVALAHGESPEVLVSYDTDWWDLREAMAEAGVKIKFLCQEAIEGASTRKKGKRRKAE